MKVLLSGGPGGWLCPSDGETGSYRRMRFGVRLIGC